MPPRNILAIDPGLKGAFALFTEKHAPWVHDLPIVNKRISVPLLHDLLVWDRSTPLAIVLEQQQSMPGNGIAGTHLNGVNYGILLGWAFTVAGASIYEVRPAVWKKALRLGKDKEQSRAIAMQLWPELGASLARKKDEGRAEALLLGYYWRQYGQELP